MRRVPHAPPPPTTALDRLLERLREAPDVTPMDPRLPHRVEEAVRRRMALRRLAGPRRRDARVVPTWLAVAAAVLLALLTALAPPRPRPSLRTLGPGLGPAASPEAPPPTAPPAANPPRPSQGLPNR